MPNDLDSVKTSSISRSGVNLEYGPEDTLKSFLLDKYLNPESTVDDNVSEINSNLHNNAPSRQFADERILKSSARPTNSQEPKRSSVMKDTEPKTKRPYLRKNQGLAAWCSRIKSSRLKLQQYSTKVRGSSVDEAQTEKVSTKSDAPRGACDEPTLTTKPSQSASSLSSAKAKFLESGNFTRQYTYESKWCPTPEHTLFPTFLSTEESHQNPASSAPSTSPSMPNANGPQGSQAPTSAPSPDKDKTDPMRCAAVVDLSETHELEEFELLEKLTEGSFCGLSSSAVAKMSKDSLLNKLQKTHQNGDGGKISASAAYVREFQPDIIGVSSVCCREETINFLGTPAPETTQGLPVPPITQSHAAVSRGNSATCVSQQVSEHRSGTSSEECLAEFDDKLPWKEDAEPQEAEVKEAASPGAATQATTRSAHFELPEVVAVTNKEPPKFSEVAGDEHKELTPTIPLPPKDASSAVIRQWIARLEVEVKRFNAENAALAKLRKDREDSLRQLEKERREFEAMKAAQARDFEDFRKEETAKMKKEKKVLADYHRTLQSMPNKRDREEIERLKQQISDLQTEAALRETRLQSQLTRQRTRIEEMANEKTELLERIKRLEQTRLTLQTSLSEERAQRHLSRSCQGVREADSYGASSTLNKPKSLTEVAQAVKFEPHARSVDRLCSHSAGVSRHPTPPVAKDTLASTRTTVSAAPSYCDLPVVLPVKASAEALPQRATTTRLPGSGEVADSSSSAEARAPPTAVSEASVTRLQGVHRADSMASDYYTDDASSSNDSSGRGHRREEPTDNAPLVAGGPKDFSLPGRLSRLALVDSPMREANRGQLTREVRHPDGSIERQYSNGGVILNYANGSVKEIYPDGKTSLVVLFNGDTKLTLSDGSVIYTYASEGTVQTTFPDGTEQTVYKDGRKEITYPPSSRSSISPTTPRVRSPCLSRPNSCRTNLAPVLVEENCLGNGITVRLFSNGDRIIELPNGQREVHCAEFKRRIYPDGTAKTVFKDGRQETCYASGRIRVKDGQGNLLVDTRIAPLSEAVRPTLVVPPPHLLI